MREYTEVHFRLNKCTSEGNVERINLIMNSMKMKHMKDGIAMVMYGNGDHQGMHYGSSVQLTENQYDAYMFAEYGIER